MEGEALRLRWWTRQDPTGQHRGHPPGRRQRTPLEPRKSVLVVPNQRVCRGGEAVGNVRAGGNTHLVSSNPAKAQRAQRGSCWHREPLCAGVSPLTRLLSPRQGSPCGIA